MPNTVNAATLALIESFEGFVDHWYPDPASHGQPYTCVFGHTDAAGSPFYADDPSRRFTLEEGSAILQTDLAKVAAEVQRLVTRPINDNQFGALVSFAYNLGIGNLQKSTLLRRVNAGDPGASSEFARWVYAAGKPMPGLVRRRAAEARLFNTPISSAPVSTPAPTPIHKPSPLETLSMNLSLFSIIIKFLPDLSALEQDIAAEVKLLASTTDGATKINQTIVILEDIIARVKAALAS